MEVERYSHVMHLVSEVEGGSRPSADAWDALFACFPAGTLSGAPKVRAMEIIDELEEVRRGVYGGAVGYRRRRRRPRLLHRHPHPGGAGRLGPGSGRRRHRLRLGAESELEECRNKASALVEAVAMAERPSPRIRDEFTLDLARRFSRWPGGRLR